MTMGKFCCIISFCVTLVVVGGLSGLISYFSMYYGRGRALRYELINASLSQFELANNNTVLQYTVAVNATLYNPNKIGAYRVEALRTGVYFANQSLLVTPWQPLVLRQHRVAYLASSNKGAIPVALPADVVSKFYNYDKVFDISVYFNVRSWTKFGRKRVFFNKAVVCYVKVPLVNSAQRFSITNCTMGKPDH